MITTTATCLSDPSSASLAAFRAFAPRAAFGRAGRRRDDLSTSVTAWFAHQTASHPSDFLAIVDPGGTMLGASANAMHLVGCIPAELVGRVLFVLAHPDDRVALQSAFERVAVENEESVAPVRIRLWHRDGTWRTFDVVVRMVERDAQYLVHARDVTNWSELTEQWQQAKRLQAVGQMACSTAPDVNSLLEAILLRTGTLLETVDGGRRRDAAAISGLAQRARTVASRLLAVARDHMRGAAA
jgi:PAS domain S-box-containing protein